MPLFLRPHLLMLLPLPCSCSCSFCSRACSRSRSCSCSLALLIAVFTLVQDDIVLVARDAKGLKELLRIVERHCGDLKLRLSVHKSKVMSGVNDLWELYQGEETVGTMEQVLQFKYLGVQTSLSPSKGAAAMRKRATVCANRYRAACLRLARDGPDVVDVCTTLWRSIAIPSITFGCESVPFSESVFKELQRHQVAVGKFALGLPVSAPNVSAEALLNMTPVKASVFKAQLKFFARLTNQSRDRWSKDALLDHLSGKWRSPYMSYISSIKQEVGLVRGPVSKKQVEIVVDHHFSQACRKEVRRMGLSAMEPLPKRGRHAFICESEASEVRVCCCGAIVLHCVLRIVPCCVERHV